MLLFNYNEKHTFNEINVELAYGKKNHAVNGSIAKFIRQKYKTATFLKTYIFSRNIKL